MTRCISVESMNFGMSTIITHSAFGKHAKESLREIYDEGIRLEGLLSRFVIESEISRINKGAGITCEKLSSDTFEVLWNAIEFSRSCQGIFDITIGPLVNLWDKGKNSLRIPEKLNIRQSLDLINYNDLLLNPCKKTAGLRRIGQSTDLGGIGKGFVGDKFLEIFKKYGVKSAFTNIGGNVVALGAKPDGSPWRVGIQHPRRENEVMGIVSVVNKAVVTSGSYQRYFVDNNGKRYHHILNPFTGYPVELGLESVTIVADSSMVSDALSTIVFLAGKKKGIELLRCFFGVEAILVDIDLQVYVTPGLKECFQPSEGIDVNILI